MNCSCPDWAVPCKHIAAVIYLLANEIDKNPFLVLLLHGLDLFKDFKQEDGNITEHATEAIQEVDSLLDPDKRKNDDRFCFPEEDIPDFSSLVPKMNNLVSLLTSKPLFSNRDFKTILLKAYQSVSRQTQKLIFSEKRELSLAKDFDKFDETTVILNEELKPVRLVLSFPEKSSRKEYALKWDDFLILLENVPESKILHCNNVVRSLALHRQFSLALAANGAFIPELLKTNSEKFLIRWVPILNDPFVKELADKMIMFTVEGMIGILLPSMAKKNLLKFSKAEESEMTTSLFLNHYVRLFSTVEKLNDPIDIKISELFFRDKPVTFNHFSEKELPNTIQLWLRKFFLKKKRYLPLLKTEEKKGWFYLDIMIEDQSGNMEEPILFNSFILQKKYSQFKFDLLRDLSEISNLLPGLDHYIQTTGKNPIPLNSNEFAEVLLNILPSLKLLGIRMMMPKALERILIPKPTLRLSKKSGQKGISFVNLDSLIDFNYQIAIGETLMDVDEFRKLVQRLSGIVRIKDQYVLLKNDDLDKLFHEVGKSPVLSSNELLKAALSGEYNGAKLNIPIEINRLLKKLSPSGEIDLPEGVQAVVRPYQLSGYRWMIQNSKIGFGSLIADDMGLGKTLQVIAAIMKFKKSGELKKKKVLVVVPTTLLTNWQKEIEKFAPSLRTLIFHGQQRKLKIEDVDVIISTYGMVRSDKVAFSKIHWHSVVIDEAQNIKNAGTDQTRAVKGLKSDVRIAMTGTPVENRLSEYWSIMDFVNKGYLGSADSFSREFGIPIQIYHDHEKAELFRKITAPFILRRVKTDKSIIQDLPDKIENNHYCTLMKEQVGLYQNIVNIGINSIEQIEHGIERRGLVLKMITGLKQICNHPDNYLKKGNANPDLSGKTMLLLDLLDNIHESGEKTLIFTQYREMGDILVSMFEHRYGFSPLFLNGSTPRKERDRMVEEFQNIPSQWIFLLSLKAGGTGLNLTAATHVIHYDLWWNPAVEAQATDRAYRIGQTKNVMVNRLITKGTFEEKIDEMLKAKKTLANLTVASGEKWIGDLSNQELKDIFTLQS